jgi:hypothetical protein
VVEHTPDGRWIVVDGRRWRATDPSIPSALRQELVDELMAQRRAVGAATRAGEDATLPRRRVHLAKVALGERGDPWWEPTTDGQRERAAAAIVTLVNHRGATSTICPSDAARAIGGDRWRDLLTVARAEARRLAREGTVEIRQRGDALDPSAPWRGPVRIGLPDVGPDST